MDFERIPMKKAKEFSGYIEDEDAFYHFVDEFGITGVHWSQPTTLSSTYFLRVLLNGSFERARGYGRGNDIVNDEGSMQMQPYYLGLLDHGAMWKLVGGDVICTAMPYGTKEEIEAAFYHMVNELGYPESIKLKFLEDEFRFRSNGDYMIVIYADSEEGAYIPAIPFEELHEKAIKYSSLARGKIYTISSFVRNQYISECAKKRANGICQLCGKPAPFQTRNGEPYLEAHHIIPLSEDGFDTIDNVVALCPNCHRKMHSLALDEDIDHLLKVVKAF